MTERILLELKSSFSANIENENDDEIYNYLQNNIELKKILEDLDFTLQSLNYSKKEIKKAFEFLLKDIKNKNTSIPFENKISFEKLLKEAMNYLDKNNSNLGR